jgi:hypothetical protein
LDLNVATLKGLTVNSPEQSSGWQNSSLANPEGVEHKTYDWFV